MSSHQRKILDMLSSGQITAEEAERLLDAVERPAAPGEPAARSAPKYLCVMVDAPEGSAANSANPITVNVRVPLQLLRAGVKLASLLLPEALAIANRSLGEKGIKLDLSQLNAGNVDELIEALREMTVDVDAEGARVKVFCE